MALESVGYYALPIIPTFKGIERGISGKIKTAFGQTGTQAGKLMGDNVAKGLDQAKAKTEAAASRHAKALDKVKDASGKARVEIEKLGEQINRGVGGSQLTAQTERVSAALRKEAEAARQAKTAETQLANARRSQAGAASQLGAGPINPLKGAEEGMQQSSGGLQALAGGLGTKVGGAFMGALGAVAGVAAVGALFKSAIDTGMDFERTVNAFSGVTAQAGDTAQTTAARMESMRQAARALGSDTQLAGVSARDAGNAMLELAKGGMSADEAMKAARGTLQLATAGQLDAAEAAKIQSAALNTWQLDASNATRVADLLAAGANASSADVHDLGLAIQQSGAVAAGFGNSVEDTVTALTLFSKWGINGSDAGTMLKTSLQAITDQGKPAQGAIDELGLSLYDANGKFVGIKSMMQQVGEASKRMSQEQFQAATATLFGSDAMRASMVAANGGAAAWDETAAAVTRQGAAAQMAGAQMQGLPGIVEALSNVWEGFKLKLFDVIDGPLIAIGHWFTDMLSGGAPAGVGQVFSALGDAFRGMGQVLGQYLMPALKQLWENIKGPLMQYGRQWVDTFKSAMPILKAVGVVIGVALLGAIKSLSITLPILIKGMTAVISVAKMIYTAIGAGINVIKPVAQFLGTVFVGAWDLLKGAFQAGWSVVQTVFGAFKAAWDALAAAGQYAWQTVLEPIFHDIGVVFGAAWSVVSPIFDMFKAAWSAIADAVVGFWQGAIVPAWEGIKGAMAAGWAAIQPIFESIKGAFQGVKDFVSGVWSGLAGIVKGALDAVVNAVKGPLRWIGGVLSRVPTSIGPIEIPGAQAARDLGGVLQGLRGGTDARGIRGPGTGTSDSILGIDAKTGQPTAWVSAGEGVVKASAMKAGGGAIVAALNGLPGMRTGGTVGPDVAAAQSMVGTPYSQGSRNDCSGSVARVILKALGMDTSGGLMSTKNAEEWLSKLGFKPGKGGPGAITVGWYDRGPNPNDGHMAMTLSNGQAFEQGGGTNGATIGDGATPGTSSEFDHFMTLPLSGISPQGSPGDVSFGATGTGTVPAGSTAGTGPQGQQGYYTPESPQRIAELEAKVSEREAKVREVQAKGDKASESERLRAERLRDEAKNDLEEAKRGKFHEFSASERSDLGGTKDTGGGADNLSGIGGIMKQFLSDTFGFGDLLPDPAELGIVKLASAIMGIKYTPQGKGFPWQTGYAGGTGEPFSGDPFAGMADQLGGGPGDILGGLIPGLTIPPPPAGDQNMPAGAPPGTPIAPGPVDQSTNITINSPQGDPKDIENRTRRTLLNTPRIITYTAPQGTPP